MTTRTPLIALALCLTLAAAPAAVATGAEEPAPAPSADDSPEPAPEEMTSFFATTTVTATGREKDAFKLSTPVAVIERAEIERKQPLNATDLLRYEPGVDVNGVGANQLRPIIRGQRGLRVLFLEDGLRMNNPRRQTDFGEITGLVAVDNVSAVEVVRGPASVLYGTDAIGGVLNLIPRAPSSGGGWRASAGIRAGTAGDLVEVEGSADRRVGNLSLRLGGSYRDTEDYRSADGAYGDIRLDKEVTVLDSGVRDDSLFGSVAYQLGDRHQLVGRFNRYRAGQSGFGFVEPGEIGAQDPTRVRILYPFQDFDRLVLGYVGAGGSWLDSVDLDLYYQQNERQLANDIDIDIGSLVFGAPPSTVEADTLNFTDLETLGARLELTRGLAGGRHLLTFGAEGFRDESFNTDFSTTTTTLRFPFPPFEVVTVSSDDVANAPNATNESWGVFAQDELALGERLSVTLGGRYQSVSTRAEPTPGWDVTGLDFDDSSVVGALNVVVRATDHLNVVASYGTAFRAPNIVERLFNGPTPEGIGYQLLNPALTSESSDSVDVGIKYRRSNAVFEAILFRSELDDGIVQDFLSPAEVAALPAPLQEEIRRSGARFVVQQRNVDRLRTEGFELMAGYRSPAGFVVGGNYSNLDIERLDSLNPPTGDSVLEKLNAYLRYEGGDAWVEYRVRHNADQLANLDPGAPVPAVGRVLPSFTVHTLSGGVTLRERGGLSHAVTVILDNLTDELYAEFSNATFFRPQPQRNLTVAYTVRY